MNHNRLIIMMFLPKINFKFLNKSNNKNSIALDLCDEHVKFLFSEFIKEKMRSNKIRQKELVDRLSFEAKTVQRYIGGGMPKTTIPQDTYIQFLEALETSDEEFRSFIAESQQDEPASGDNLWAGALLLVSSFIRQFPKPSQRLPRFFFYLPLWAIPLIAWGVFALWENQTTYYERGIMAKEQKQHAKAIELFRMAINKENRNVGAYYELADIYAELTDQDKAIDYYREGIAKDTKFSSRAYNNLALLLLSQGDINSTLALLYRARKNIVTPIEKERWAQSGIILKNRAWAYWKKELYIKAMKFIIQAQEQLGPAQMLDLFPEVFCLHALIAKHTGDDPGPAEQLCINRFEAYQAKQQSGALGNTIKPIRGMTYELYLLVLKQHDNK